MGAEPLSIPIEDLLAHSGWVRALARSLVRDAGLAEDLVQETWLAALKSPPEDRRNLRGWLGRVLSNAARQRARREGVREGVESAERPAPQNLDPDDLAAAAESQRELTKHVLELEEPYRATLLLRYWHGQNATQIAAREGLAPGTVRWRLKEGLERLRVRLDDTHGGDRKAWCLALVPLLRQEGAVLAGSATLPALVSGVLGMNLFLKILLGGTALFLAYFGLRMATSMAVRVVPTEPAAVRSLAARRVEPSGGAGDRARSEVAQAEPERATASTADAPSALDSAAQPLARVTARVVDESGAPIEDAGLRVSWNTTPSTRAADGSVTLDVKLPEDAASMGLGFVVHAFGYETRHFEAVVTRAQALDLGDMVLAPGGNLAGRVVDEAGRPVFGASVVHDVAKIPVGGLARERRDRTSTGAPWTSVMTDMEGRFVLEGLPVGEVRIWATREGSMAASSDVVTVAGAKVGTLDDLVLEHIARGEVIAGRVVDPEGNPVPHALLTLRSRSWLGSDSNVTTTDENGEFEVFCKSRAARDVRASVGDGRFQDALVRRVRPGTVGLEVRLARPLGLVFDVRDESGARIEGVELELRESERGPRIRSHLSTLDDGTLSVTVPGERFVARLSAEGRQELHLGPYDPSALPELVECTLRTIPTLRGRIHTRGRELSGVQVEVFMAADGFAQQDGFPLRVRPTPLAQTSTSESAFSVTLRKSGSYYLRAESTGEGVLEVGPFEFDSTVGLDLGELEMFRGGTIAGQVRGAKGEGVAGTIVAVSRGDGRARTQRVGPDGAFRFDNLIAGPWQVELSETEINPWGSPSSFDGLRPVAAIPANCEVVLGEVTTFDLEIGSRAACTLSGRLLVDGEAAEGWTVGLHSAGLRVLTGDAQGQRSDANGAFRLARQEPGSYSLLIEGDLDANLLADVRLELGEQAWSAEFERAELDLEGLGASLDEGLPAALVLWEREGWWAMAQILPDEDGVARGLRVPAGRARVCLFDLSVLMGGDPRDLPTHLELVLPAGELTRVRLP